MAQFTDTYPQKKTVSLPQKDTKHATNILALTQIISLLKITVS